MQSAPRWDFESVTLQRRESLGWLSFTAARLSLYDSATNLGQSEKVSQENGEARDEAEKIRGAYAVRMDLGWSAHHWQFSVGGAD
jgi:hypothetical protein